jgi:hypothetical protein
MKRKTFTLHFLSMILSLFRIFFVMQPEFRLYKTREIAFGFTVLHPLGSRPTFLTKNGGKVHQPK